MKITEIIDLRNNHWTVYRRNGNYYSRSVCAKIFKRCSVKSVATVLGIESKEIRKLLGE